MRKKYLGLNQSHIKEVLQIIMEGQVSMKRTSRYDEYESLWQMIVQEIHLFPRVVHWVVHWVHNTPLGGYEGSEEWAKSSFY